MGVWVWVRGAGAQSAAAHGAAMLGVGAGGGRPLPQRGSGGITPGKFRNFTSKILNFGAHFGKIIYLLR
jgi:hypothetical protein